MTEVVFTLSVTTSSLDEIEASILKVLEDKLDSPFTIEEIERMELEDEDPGFDAADEEIKRASRED